MENSNGAVAKLLGIAAVVGLLAGGGAVAFLAAEHQLQKTVWSDIPQSLGGTPGWYIFVVLIAGAAGVFLATKLPGHGGHRPLDGLGFNIGPKEITSVVVAALVSLTVGAVVGPEAPLMAVGSALGGFIAMRAPEPARRVLLAASSAAATTNITGTPIIPTVIVLERAVHKGSPGGKKVMLAALPVLIAMGFGYLVQVGVGDWSGVGQSQLAVPGLPVYETVQVADLGWALVVALAVAILAVLAVEAGTAFQDRISSTLVKLLIGGTIVAAAAVITRAITGEGVDTILFSGQEAMTTVLGLTSVSVLIVIGIAKTIAYSVSLGAGFRGGMVFPSVYLGVVIATAADLMLDGVNLSAMVATGIAAAVAGVMRLPFTAVLLALLLCSGAGLAVTTPAIIGAVVGVLVRAAADARLAKDEAQPAGEPLTAG